MRNASAPRLLVAGLVVAAVLAGCLGAAPDASTADGTVASPAFGLHGVVIDLAIRPLAGVTVAIPARADVPPVVTAEDGTFAFDGLDAGVVFLEAAKPGYLSSTVQALVQDEAQPVLQIMLEPLLETKPWFALEEFHGFMECGVGSAPAFGLTAGCMVVAGATLYVVCTGNPPIPPTGVCLGEADPYFFSTARGNMTMSQTEAVWRPSVPNMSELLIGSYVVDAQGAIVGGAPTATGQSVLVRRIDAPTTEELQLGGANSLAIFVNPGNSGAANVVASQAYDVYHTSTFYFELDADWVFAESGPPVPPEQCTVC